MFAYPETCLDDDEDDDVSEDRAIIVVCLVDAIADLVLTCHSSRNEQSEAEVTAGVKQKDENNENKV